MARKVRVEFEGAIYHVMCRGDRRENIFEDDADRARFLESWRRFANGPAGKSMPTS